MNNPIIRMDELAFQWPVEDPFIAAMHHQDAYPRGGENLGPAKSSLGGRNIGADFSAKDGWSMYHGATVPGFPAHPHRGFETVTIVLEGYVDHSDSAGLAGRYGQGDVQWMTAGRGMQHAEMFPLLNQAEANPLHLFQLWLNLPAKDKFVAPSYNMLWAEDIPVIEHLDAAGRKSVVRLIAGKFQGRQAVEPAPSSWAHDESHLVNIWIVALDPGAEFTIPAVSAAINRNIYFYQGDALKINGRSVAKDQRLKLDGSQEITLSNGDTPGAFLLLEGQPIDEPVFAYGPFVMNTREEILKASRDYRETAFGGWPWEREDPIHGGEIRRFARYEDGSEEER